jgi:methionine aminopeptidase
VHEIVRLAQQAGVEAVLSGVSCQEIDRAAKSVITDAGYGEQFIHRTGHGIGVATHEPPYMVEGEEHRSWTAHRRIAQADARPDGARGRPGHLTLTNISPALGEDAGVPVRDHLPWGP